MITIIEYMAVIAANGVFLAAAYLIPYVIWASIDDNLREAIAFKKNPNAIYFAGRIAFFLLVICLSVLSLYGLCHVVISTTDY